MSSLQGTTQAYQPMASTYIALAPSCGDKIFGTNIDYCDLVNWGIYDGQENDPRVLRKYLKDVHGEQTQLFQAGKQAIRQSNQQNTPTSYNTSPASQSTTVWSVLESLPNVNMMKKILAKSKWMDYITNANPLYKITLFVPTDQAFQSTSLAHIPYENWNANDLRLIGQAHTLPFAFEQNSAYNRKLRLYTSLDAFSVYLDGTGEVSDQLNFYIPPNEMLAFQYPQPLKRINILQGFYTNNGALYIIDGVFQPQVIIN